MASSKKNGGVGIFTISKSSKHESMVTARQWRSELPNTQMPSRAEEASWREQGSKSCQDKPATARDQGWGLNILKQQEQQKCSKLHRGSFVDLIADAGLAKLTLRDDDASSTSRESASVTSIYSSTQRRPVSGRASSQASSSAGSSSDNIDAYFDQDVDDVCERQTGVARAAYKRGLSQRRIRGSSSSDQQIESNSTEGKDEANGDLAKGRKGNSQQSQQAQVENLFHAVKTKDEEAIRSIYSSARMSLESTDKNGMTPLIVSCLDGSLLQMARLLIGLGANVHGYRPGLHAGYPLHHAAKRGHDHIVALLLSCGASALAVNDDGQTALDMARIRGHASVVRVIEDWISLFRGILRQVTDNAGSQIMKRIWAVVLPSDVASGAASRHELVVYNSRKVPMPESVILLGSVTSEFEEPDYLLADPSLIVTDKVTKTKFKFFSQEHGDKKQLLEFYRACKGVQQERRPSKGESTETLVSQIKAPPRELDMQYVGPPESLRMDEHRPSGGQCVVCKKQADAAATTRTCGHVCSSLSCMSKLKSGLCPACRARGRN